MDTVARNTRAVPGRGTPKRSIRVPDELWQAALDVAKRRGDTLNEVLRSALERYVAKDERARRKREQS